MELVTNGLHAVEIVQNERADLMISDNTLFLNSNQDKEAADTEV
ncbi:hypothetical protein [Virgibacillus ihumii]|nr:hypothetical protein [Virgibacillus ihumii]